MISHCLFTEEELFDDFRDEMDYESVFWFGTQYCVHGHLYLEENDDLYLGSGYACRVCQDNIPFKRRSLKQTGDKISIDKLGDRDGWICQICLESVDPKSRGTRPMSRSIDHVNPISMGGSHTWENVQLAHFSCNARKGGRNRMTNE